MTVYCQVLTPNRLRKKGLQSWNCAFPKENGHYQALYPQSWTTYDLPNQKVRLLCKQLSPFIPHNYKVLIINFSNIFIPDSFSHRTLLYQLLHSFGISKI